MKKYFKDLRNLISFGLGTILSFVFFVFNRDMLVPIWIFMISVFLLLMVTWLLIKSRIDLHDLSPTNHIQIIDCSHNVCICKANNLLAHSSWVTFFHRSGEFEKAIAYGVVKALTEQGAAQIQVYPVDPEEQDILDIINNEKANILVRPTLTSDAISNIAKYV